MKEIEVACAIIEKKGKLLIAQRRPGDSLGGLWEFPGGKKRVDETLEQCLVREVYEELKVTVRVREFIRKDTYAYPKKIIHLHFFIAVWCAGDPVRAEVLDYRWVRPEDLRSFQFPVGDDALLQQLLRLKNLYFNPSVRNQFVLPQD